MKKPEDISDAETNKVLSDPELSSEIKNFLREKKVSISPEKLPPDVLKAAIADIYNRKSLLDAKKDALGATFTSCDYISDDVVAKALLNEEMRKALENQLKASNSEYPLELASPDTIKAAISTIILNTQLKQSEAQQIKTNCISPVQISDELLNAALANHEVRKILSAGIKSQGIDEPISQVSRDTVKETFAAIATLARQPATPCIPDHLLDQIFSDAKACELLRDVMKQNNIKGEPHDLSDIAKRFIVYALIKQGAISFGENKDL
ncbi:MAG: hypothetical protein HRT83_04940 [Hyphomicrobiaceae bacterium]|nr:hypothetical protein [Hyphomicrobiaceae bacterium]